MESARLPHAHVRPAVDGDEPAVRRMLSAYHLVTEREKRSRVDRPDQLPASYRSEIADAMAATGALLVLDARGATAGMYVLAPTPDPGIGELKRLWVEPDWRGRGLGEWAVHDAIRRSGDAGMTTLRLTVWEWRTGAIGLYRRAGFLDCPSWDPRPGLLCLERPAG
jgi:ribosomal protein S18 acetylase RimI-like enzyme